MQTKIAGLLEKSTDEEIFNEAARRLKDLVERAVGDKFTYGQVEFVFHAGHFTRIDCKPSLRAYVGHEMGMTLTTGGRRER